MLTAEEVGYLLEYSGASVSGDQSAIVGGYWVSR